MRLRLVAYTRVSTKSQADRGLGLVVQRDQVRKWVKAEGHEIVAWTEDRGLSGSNGIEHRVGLLEAVQAIQDGAADGLVVARLDRLARALHVQEGTLLKVWDNDGRVFAVDQGEVLRDDPDDPLRTFVRQILGAVGQLDRAMISARLRAGQRAKKAQGGYYAGSPPFGWRAESGALVPDPDEQTTLKLMRRRRKSGHTFQAIADELNESDVSSKNGGVWSRQSVHRTLETATRTERPARRKS